MRTMTAEQAKQLYVEKQMDVRAIAGQLNITRSAVYNALVRAGVLTRTPAMPRAERDRRVFGPINEGSLTFVDRDPCFKCGIRRDLGCEHTA